MKSEWLFKHPTAFVLLLLAFALAMVFAYGIRRRRRALRAFADEDMIQRIAPLEEKHPWDRLLIACAVLVALVIALARPVSNPHPKEVVRNSRDLVFVLDVSRSMFAEDCQPNRLEAAKLAIADCVAALPQQRVGLVVFAGTAAIKCPLTSDRLFFNELLTKLGPGDVSHGGTLIRDALLKTTEKLLSEERAGYQDVILITDGGSHEADPETAIAALDKAGARLICIGIGTDRQGVRIPAEEGPFPYVRYQEKEVRTRLESQYLRDIAAAVQKGVYLHVATRTVDLADVYKQIVASDPTMRDESDSMIVYDEQFQYFAGLAGILLLILLIPNQRLRGMTQKTAPMIIIALCIHLALPMPARAQDAAFDQYQDEFGEDEVGIGDVEIPTEFAEMSAQKLYNHGNTSYREENFDEAAAAYETALNKSTGKLAAHCAYNLGNTRYRLAANARPIDAGVALSHIGQAVYAFRKSLTDNPKDRTTRINLELSVRLRMELEKELEQQQQQQSQKQEDQGESDESDSEGEPDESEGDEQGEGESQMESMPAGESDMKVDLQAEGTPPPNLDPQQVLEEERQNNARRSAASKSRQGGKVEKDW